MAIDCTKIGGGPNLRLPFDAPGSRERGAKGMNSDAKRNGVTPDEAQVSDVERVSVPDASGASSAAQKGDLDTDWLSMTTQDPALYLKDAE